MTKVQKYFVVTLISFPLSAFKIKKAPCIKTDFILTGFNNFLFFNDIQENHDLSLSKQNSRSSTKFGHS